MFFCILKYKALAVWKFCLTAITDVKFTFEKLVLPCNIPNILTPIFLVCEFVVSKPYYSVIGNFFTYNFYVGEYNTIQ